ncbi:MAG: hypothetical protein CMP11_08765 [Zetaproteobacteria bacterium]|nr:hypothetical protein [Pseudobdellovibrionaceae bacterium]
MKTKKNTNIKQILKTFFTTFFIFSASNCVQEQKSNTVRTNGATTNSLNNSSDNEESNDREEPEKIDTSLLKIYNVSISDVRQNNGNIQQIASFDLPYNTGYTTFTICPKENTDQECSEDYSQCAEGGACVTQIANYSRIIIPKLYAGEVEITFQACIDDRSRSLNNEPCGPKKIVYYDSKRANIEVLKLLNEERRYKEAAANLVLDYRQFLEEWEKETIKCMKQNADADKLLQTKLRFVQQYMTAPYNYTVDVALGYPGVENVSAEVDAFKTKTQDFLAEECVNMTEAINEADKKLIGCTFAAGAWEVGKMFATGVNPATAVQQISNAIHTLADPRNSVPLLCSQEEKLSENDKTYYLQINAIQTNYSKVVEELKALGEWGE